MCAIYDEKNKEKICDGDVFIALLETFNLSFLIRIFFCTWWIQQGIDSWADHIIIN